MKTCAVSSGDDGAPVGVIVGASVGAVAIIAGIIAIVCCCNRKQAGKQPPQGLGGREVSAEGEYSGMAPQ